MVAASVTQHWLNGCCYCGSIGSMVVATAAALAQWLLLLWQHWLNGCCYCSIGSMAVATAAALAQWLLLLQHWLNGCCYCGSIGSMVVATAALAQWLLLLRQHGLSGCRYCGSICLSLWSQWQHVWLPNMRKKQNPRRKANPKTRGTSNQGNMSPVPPSFSASALSAGPQLQALDRSVRRQTRTASTGSEE